MCAANEEEPVLDVKAAASGRAPSGSRPSLPRQQLGWLAAAVAAFAVIAALALQPGLDPDATRGSTVAVASVVAAMALLALSAGRRRDAAAGTAGGEAGERFRILFDGAPIPIAVRRGTGLIFANPAFANLLGLSGPDEAIGRDITEFVAEGQRDGLAGRVRSRDRSGRIEPYEITLVRRDGVRLPVRFEAARIDLPDGPAIAALLVDLRDEKGATEALRASELRYRMLIDLASDPIFVTDASGQYVDVNEAACRLLGYERDELLRLTVRDLAPPGSESGGRRHDEHVRNVAASLRGGTLIREWDLRRRDGSLVPVEISSRRLPDGGVHAIVRDISARRKGQAERDRLVAAVDQASDSILMTGPDGEIVYANPSFSAITGHSIDEALGRTPSELVRGQLRGSDQYAELDAAWTRGVAWAGHVRGQRPDGEIYELDLTTTPIVDDAGTVTGWVEIGRDVSRERVLEAQLRQAQKMEAVGRLAGGVAHDFNNLLTAIVGYGQMLAADLAEDSTQARDVSEILLAADRARTLTSRLLAFSRKAVLQPRVIDLNEVVEGFAPMLRRLIGEDVELVLRLRAEVSRTVADPGHLEQVLMNLAINGRDAMPYGGVLTLETRDVCVDAAFVAQHPGAVPGRYVSVSVSDTGVGIPPDVLEHLFEPFFTTKEQGKGTGLGLSTVFGIVEQSNGYVWVETAVGRGTTITVQLPATDAVPTATRSAAVTVDAAAGRETILVVEDEPAVRALAARILAARGYEVLCASNGLEGLAVARDHPGRIDLLFSDVVMPAMTGPELARRLQVARPDVRVLLTSGYTEEAIVRRGVTGSGPGFLGKPYAAPALLRAVRDALAGEAPLLTA